MFLAVLQADVRGNLAVAASESTDDRAEGGTFRRLGKTGINLFQFMLHRLDELKRADQGQLVGNAGLKWEEFADVHAGNIGPDRLEFPAKLGRGIRFQVVHVDMAGSASEADHDDRPWRFPCACSGLQAEDIGQ
jgi:hypothetical protein